MPEASETWDDLGERAAPTRFGDVRRFAEIDSTNRYLLDEARSGALEGVVAVADHQTSGRGRRGRTWEADSGSSLLVSVLLRPAIPAGRAHFVTMAAGVAMCEAVWLSAGFWPSLKWPNDLVVGERKLAGMLAEADVEGSALGALVVGIGVNVNRDEFGGDLADVAISCSQVTGGHVDRADLLGHFLVRLEDRYTLALAGGGDRVVLAAYRERCSTLGSAVRVERSEGDVVEGTAVDVTADGHLVLSTGGSEVTVAVGDVVHLRPSRGS